jgi:prepilin-type N-terminal cleavage/methylation domain-containing protein
MDVTKLNEKKGFTIVETLIVLAIAALILIIVLIAVPDLQRSAQNSNLRTDAQNVAAAIQTFEGNNQGELPGSITASNGVVTVSASSASGSGGTSGIPATGHIQASTTINSLITGPQAQTYSGSNNTTIYVETQAECPSSVASGTITPKTNQRGVAIIFPIDNGSGYSAGCIQD